MSNLLSASDLSRKHIYMVGIKGTGMAALAEILAARGAELTGSDVEEEFYTDSILRKAGIPYHNGFSVQNLPDEVDLVIYSAAYDVSTHPELVELYRRGLPMLRYTEALGRLSVGPFSVGITGVHGKTTTTALVAAIVGELALPVTVLAGSALAGRDGRSTLIQGTDAFVAETCEYRRHFLDFAPDVILVTSVEADHLDYFRDFEDVCDAFVEYGRTLPENGVLIYCGDDRGAFSVAQRLVQERRDLRLRSYGITAACDSVVTPPVLTGGSVRFSLDGERYELAVPGVHNALNAAGAILVVEELYARVRGGRGRGGRVPHRELAPQIRKALAHFRGTRRRAERVGEAQGILVLDDYAHHPTAIETTLAGFRSFYPGRRLVLSFMSHTFTRTRSLLPEFAHALLEADVLFLHDIYASAREANPGNLDGTVLAEAVRRAAREKGQGEPALCYVANPDEAVGEVMSMLEPGDLFVTMGAGNNWRLGRLVLEELTTPHDRTSEAAND
ncbi:MAG: UDP-N-acetylmuramate--L-alanine ligase [Spirochaetales bacterium]